ncbi:MAG: succinylglutamate desuccinylase/aspartoacylase family protein [Planctomycetes bacterium]|nr:succinylglutamate desuccinylase/aspartoacylase family protein [Planctomycetota bacterium]
MPTPRLPKLLAAALLMTGCAMPTVEDPDAGAVAPTAWTTIGTSVEGRPLRIRTIGRGPVAVLWIGGIHGDEIEGQVATDELPAAFAATPGLAARVTLTILEDVNPDGRAKRTRGNARGIDLNRNYPATNYQPGDARGERALCEPESRALFDLLLHLQPDLVMVAHSWTRRSGRSPAAINWDGPAEPYARLFAARSGFEAVPSASIHGTPGSLGSFVGIDRQIPILTIEWAKGTPPAEAWVQTSDAILAVLASATERSAPPR